MIIDESSQDKSSMDSTNKNSPTITMGSPSIPKLGQTPSSEKKLSDLQGNFITLIIN
jgi:hypothetical protein